MAAADFYAHGVRPPFEQPNILVPPLPPQRANSSQPALGRDPSSQHRQPGHPSPLQQPAQQSSHPPPPYQPLGGDQKPGPSVRFASSSPMSNPPLAAGAVPPPRHSFHDQSRPNFYPMNQPNYQASQAQLLPPFQQGPPQMNQQGYIYPQAQQQQQQTYHPSQYQPRPSRSHRDPEYHEHGYVSDPETPRRRHKARSRRTSDHSRSTATDGLIGAAGAGLIGDLICPGLGALGGALVGYIGGKDYGKHRKWREERLDREQDRWERKYGSRSESRSHSRDGRRSSHERRKNHD